MAFHQPMRFKGAIDFPIFYAFDQGYSVKHQPVQELFTPNLLGS